MAAGSKEERREGGNGWRRQAGEQGRKEGKKGCSLMPSNLLLEFVLLLLCPLRLLSLMLLLLVVMLFFAVAFELALAFGVALAVGVVSASALETCFCFLSIDVLKMFSSCSTDVR